MRLLFNTAAFCLAFAAGAWATPMAATIPAPSLACRSAILLAERESRVPDRLLNAIATVESGRRDPASGVVYPWPWTINVEGAGHFYETKAEAIAAVQGFQAQGLRSIDVGCMQVNLMHHPDAFATLEQAFDPVANAIYAARFLTQLFTQTNAWPRAAAAYHSWTPELGADYARRVLAAWGVPQPPPAALDAAAIDALAAATPFGMAESGLPGPRLAGSGRIDPRLVGSGLPTPRLAASGQDVSGTYAAPAGGRVAVMMPSGSNGIRVVTMGGSPAGSAGTGVVGRGLDGYRATPILAAGRFARAFSPRVIRPTGF